MLQACNIQPVNSVRKSLEDDFDKLLSVESEKQRLAFLAGLSAFKEGVTPEMVMEAYTLRGVAGLQELFSRELIAAYYSEYLASVTQTYANAGSFWASRIKPFTGTQGVEIRATFNIANPKTAAVIEQKRFDLITRISEDARGMIRDIVNRDFLEGVGPMKTAQNIRQHLGLSGPQMRYVDNYRKELENLSSRALGRELRDRRFDSVINRAIANGKELPQDKIDRMVNRYTERLIRQRSETIARTETMEAVNTANHMQWQQMIDDNMIDVKQVVRFWRTSGDTKVRHAHATIPRLNENGVSQDGKFKSPLGPISRPGDPDASAGNRINCRCYIDVKLLDPEDSE